MWEYFAVLRRHHVIYLTFNTINTSNLIYLRHPYGGFTRQHMILCCFCFHLAALSVNGPSERLLFQPLYKCKHISLINDTVLLLFKMIFTLNFLLQISPLFAFGGNSQTRVRSCGPNPTMVAFCVNIASTVYPNTMFKNHFFLAGNNKYAILVDVLLNPY